jgi:RNA polymerase sigma factor for flagellar operon FliA
MENRGLVYGIVASMCRGRRSWDDRFQDLVQFGMEGLLKAADRFDATRGCQFPTYAVWKIRGAIKDGLRDSSWFPRGAHHINAARYAIQPESLDAVVVFEEPGSPVPVIDAIPGGTEPEQECERSWDADEVDQALCVLNDRERECVRLYFWEGLLMKDIGERLGVSESRICQIIGHARDKLRRVLTPA